MSIASAFRPAWTPLTIALMVLGFIIYTPLGLAMIAYILWGDHFERAIAGRGLQHYFRDCRRRQKSRPSERPSHADEDVDVGESSGNAAFDAYRAKELERLARERLELDQMRAEFEDYLRSLRNTEDRKDFEKYMDGLRRRSRPLDD